MRSGWRAARCAALWALACGAAQGPHAPPRSDPVPGWLAETAEQVLAALDGRPVPPPELPGWPVSSPVGWRRDPFTGRRGWHAGVDLAAPAGAVVPSPSSGLVLRAGPRGRYGLAVELAAGRGCRVLLAHLSRVGVRPGQIVPRGWPLGLVGSSGRSTAPHLHVEHRCDGSAHRPPRGRQGSGSPPIRNATPIAAQKPARRVQRAWTASAARRERFSPTDSPPAGP